MNVFEDTTIAKSLLAVCHRTDLRIGRTASHPGFTLLRAGDETFHIEAQADGYIVSAQEHKIDCFSVIFRSVPFLILPEHPGYGELKEVLTQPPGSKAHFLEIIIETLALAEATLAQLDGKDTSTQQDNKENVAANFFHACKGHDAEIHRVAGDTRGVFEGRFGDEFFRLDNEAYARRTFGQPTGKSLPMHLSFRSATLTLSPRHAKFAEVLELLAGVGENAGALEALGNSAVVKARSVLMKLSTRV